MKMKYLTTDEANGTREFDAGLLLADLNPQISNLIEGQSEYHRYLELIRLQAACPARCIGYIPQIERGSRPVRLDAIRQLQLAGIVFNIDANTIEN